MESCQSKVRACEQEVAQALVTVSEAKASEQSAVQRRDAALADVERTRQLLAVMLVRRLTHSFTLL